MITIDGSFGEGGGALIRTAVCMSALTEQPVRILNVRLGSRFAGIDPEDLTLINALSTICSAEVSGAELGSSDFVFHPTRRPRSFSGVVKSVRNDLDRGANANIILGCLIPVLARTGAYSVVMAEGETYGSHSLSFDYFQKVTLEALKGFGLYAYATLEEAGFGRDSAGEVSLEIEPSALKGLQWTDRGRFIGLKAVLATAGVAPAIAERGFHHLKKLAHSANLPLETEHHELPGNSSGVHGTVWAVYERGLGGGTALGSRGLRVEALAQNAFEQAFSWMSSDATVDPFLADQVLLTAALCEEESTFKVSRLTSRFLTSTWVIKQFVPIHITIRGQEDQPGTVTIRR